MNDLGNQNYPDFVDFEDFLKNEPI